MHSGQPSTVRERAKTVAGQSESEETNVQGETHVASLAVPPHGRGIEEWRQSIKSGTKEDRMLREVTVVESCRVVYDGPE